MNDLRIPMARLGAGLLFAGSLLGAAAPASADDPALAKFADAWSKVDSYTVVIKVHEVQGTDVQDRTYNYAYLKPHYAKTDIVAGPGKGGGAVWTGGDTVKGHQGGFLSGIKLTIPLTDGRAVSLRGDTMDTAVFGYILNNFEKTKGDLTDAAGPTIDGVATDQVTLKVADPTTDKGITRDVLDLSSTTSLPVRRLRYVNDQLVKQEDFSNLKLNPGLQPSDF